MFYEETYVEDLELKKELAIYKKIETNCELLQLECVVYSPYYTKTLFMPYMSMYHVQNSIPGSISIDFGVVNEAKVTHFNYIHFDISFYRYIVY